MPMIEIKNVSKWYGDFQVLRNCSTSVEKGEVVVICGPSGSGKSTLIKTVNALESICLNCALTSAWFFSISNSFLI